MYGVLWHTTSAESSAAQTNEEDEQPSPFVRDLQSGLISATRPLDRPAAFSYFLLGNVSPGTVRLESEARLSQDVH